MTIKEHLVECYRGHGLDFMTACDFATKWLKDLKTQRPGTVWTLGPNRLGVSVTVRRD